MMYSIISSSSCASQPMAANIKSEKTNSIPSISAGANISPKHPPRLADDNASTKTENTMSNLSLKMNNQDVERFEHQVDDMYSILVNISSELVNIKGMMEANRRFIPETSNASAVATVSAKVTATATAAAAAAAASAVSEAIDSSIVNNNVNHNYTQGGRITNKLSTNKVDVMRTLNTDLQKSHDKSEDSINKRNVSASSGIILKTSGAGTGSLNLQGANHVSSNVRFENFTGLKHRANGGNFSKNDSLSFMNGGSSENNDLKHNSYPLMNNQNVNLTKAERDHILLFDPHPNSLLESGSLTGGYSSMGRDGKLGFKKNHEVYNTRDLATSPSLPNMTSTISASVVHYNSDDIESPMPPDSPSSFNKYMANHNLKDSVTLNVGGKRHEVRWDTLDKFPTSRLGRLRHCVTHRGAFENEQQTHIGIQELCDAYSLTHKEFYFDRSPRNFDAILGLYRTGKLHLSQGVCVQDFCEELEYWGLCDLHLEPCCQHTYYRARWLLPQVGKAEENMEEYFGLGFCGNMQHKLWNLVENPNSSFAAKIVAILSCLFVVASTLSLIISTMPMFQVEKQLADDLVNGSCICQKEVRNETQYGNDPEQKSSSNEEEHFIFSISEAVFVGWFTFEYIIRYIAAPQKCRFIKAGMNIIDLMGVLPYFMSLIIRHLGESGATSAGSYQDEMMRIAQIFRIMRILRIFKLARHITGLQTLGFTLKNSYKELGLLMLVVIMGMLIFSGLAYVSEKNEPDTRFVSMPEALYWAIITMTSVGYGDISPTTGFGKIVGSACAICGVLCISLPIPIIVNNFNKFYEKAKIEEEIEAKRKRTSWEDAKRDLMDARRKSCMVAAGDWKKLFKGSATPHRPSVPTISEESNSSMTGNRIDHRMQEVTFEDGCKDIPTLISTSQQTPSISSRRKEVIKNHLSDPNLDT